MKTVFLFLLLTTASIQSFALITNEHRVEDQITRSGRPALDELRGFKTIIDIETPGKAVSDEKKQAARLGIKFIASPLSVDYAPTNAQIYALISQMKNKDNQPLLIHCFHGEDRTGLVVGLYRVFVSGWTPEQAYQEMLDNGFHPKFVSLKNYFFKRTKGK